MCKQCHLLHMNISSHCSEPYDGKTHVNSLPHGARTYLTYSLTSYVPTQPPRPKDPPFTARLKLQIFLDQGIRDVGTVAAWKSRRNSDWEVSEAQQKCAREFDAVWSKVEASGKVKS